MPFLTLLTEPSARQNCTTLVCLLVKLNGPLSLADAGVLRPDGVPQAVGMQPPPIQLAEYCRTPTSESPRYSPNSSVLLAPSEAVSTSSESLLRLLSAPT